MSKLIMTESLQAAIQALAPHIQKYVDLTEGIPMLEYISSKCLTEL